MSNKYIEQNPKKWAEYHKKWCAEHPEKVKSYAKKIIDSGYAKKWRNEHKEQEAIRKAKWYQDNKERVKKVMSEYHAKNKKVIENKRQKNIKLFPEKFRAMSIIKRLKRNKIIIALPCEICGDIKSEAHHDDYSKPDKVRWLCRIHHRQADIQRRARELSINK